MKIGFIGLGIMGESMCENIVKKHDDTVYCFDFIPAKVELLASKGAVPCKDSVELVEKSDVIISMVPKSEHSMSVYKTILPVLGAGKTCIDMSTIDPSVSVEISKMVKATGAAFMDAPVVKSKPAAIAGKLGLYMGGDIAETVIRTDRPELPNALIFGDSFTNPVECLAYYSFNELRSVDLRHYTVQSLSDYIAAYQPDVVLCVRDYQSLLLREFNGDFFS